MADISKVKLPDNVTYNLKDSGAVRKTGDTMTGNLILYREGTTTQNYPTQLFFQNKDITTGKTSQGTIRGYDGGEYGLNMVINPAGNLFIGSGEAADNHYGLYPHNTGENFYATADGNMYLQANGQTIANRVGVIIDTSHNIMPSKADTATNNIGSIGTSSYKWANGYFTNINGVAVGNSPKFTDNNTTYTLSADTTNNQIKLTPSSGTAQSVTVPYATSADSATNAYYLQDSVRTSYRLKYINTNDSTTANADTLGETTSIAITTTTPTGAPTTNHALWFNIKDIGTPFQLFFPDNQLYIYKRYKTSGTSWGDWTKMRAGYADSAGSATNATTATTAQKIINDTIRPTSANTATYDGALRYFLSTSSMATSKPMADGAILDMQWDNNGGYNKQLYIGHQGGTATRMQVRSQSSGTWGSWIPIGVFSQTTPTSGQVVITDGTDGGIKSSGYTIEKSVPSNAVFTDVNVKVNNTNPTTGTWYYPVWYTGTSGTGNVNANDGLRYYSLQGTASAAGRSILSLGNSTATGTAGNKYGEIRIYSQKQGYSTLTMVSGATAERKHTLPDVAGTIGVFTATPTSGQVVVSDGTAGGFKTTGYTIAKSVPSNAVFTDSSGNNRVLRAGDNMTGSLTTTGSFIADTQVGAPTIAASSNLYAGDFCKITSSGTTGTNGSAYIRAINDESGTTHTLIKIGNGSISCENSAGTPVSLTASGLELSHATPLIDFHHNSSTQDFTSRIITTNLAELTFYGKNSGGTTVYGTCRGAAFTVVSSKYVKENIKDITTDEAKKLLQLRPVSFDYKYTGETNKRGLIAEEVLEVMPEMVNVPEDYSEPVFDEIPDNVPSIDYSKFVPYLIKMAQIQQKEIDELKARI